MEAVSPTALLGEWQLTRWVRDELLGRAGTVAGCLTLRAEGGQIAWQEQGTLLWNGSRMPVTRSYVVRMVEGRWWLHFSDGRPFHVWSPGRWVHHPCGPDSYRGLICIEGPQTWHIQWDVRGPATSQRIRTYLSRSRPREEPAPVATS